jgi:hypothetical protein
MLELGESTLAGHVEVPRLFGLVMRVGAKMSVAIGQAAHGPEPAHVEFGSITRVRPHESPVFDAQRPQVACEVPEIENRFDPVDASSGSSFGDNQATIQR